MAFEFIDREECIGDSLTKINLNAQNFDSRINTLDGRITTTENNISTINSSISGLFSTGMIMMWSGAIENIPTGWALCDGLNGTPDLKNRFVVGAGSIYQIGSTGGADNVRLTVEQMPIHNHGGVTGGDTPNHTHTGTTGEDYPDHSHPYNTISEDPPGFEFGTGGNRDTALWNSYNTSGASVRHTHNFTTGNPNVQHTHSIQNAGQNQFHENRPPYYALAYIMKL